MSRNGSGTYSRAVASYVAGTVIDQVVVNQEMDDIASALTASIAKNGETVPSANLPMGTYRHTGVGNGSARTDYAAMGQVQDGKVNWVDGGGTADAITATYSPAIMALVDGQLCHVRATAANATTTPTFSPNSLTARTIVKNGGVALVAGDIVGDGHELILRYDLANTRWELMNPLSAYQLDADLTAIAALANTDGNIIVGNGSTWVAESGATARTSLGVVVASTTTAGLVEQSTLAENQSGTDDTVFPSVLGVAQQLAARVFTSADQTITSGGSLAIAHGFSAAPTKWQLFLRCLTAEAGYSIGDVISVPPGFYGAAIYSVAVVPDATNLNCRFSSTANVFGVVNFSTGGSVTLTNANWAFFIRAEK